MENLNRSAWRDLDDLATYLTDVIVNARASAEWACMSETFREYLEETARQAEHAREAIHKAMGE